MRGVRKEINYSEPCSNAPDKAVEFGLYPFEHLLAALARAQMGTTQTQLCFILGIWAWFGIIYFLNKTFADIYGDHETRKISNINTPKKFVQVQ